MPDSDIQRLVERIEGAGGPDRELDDEIAFAVSAMGEKVPCGHTLNRLTGHKSGIAARRFNMQKAKHKGRCHISNQKRRQITREQETVRAKKIKAKDSAYRALKDKVRLYWIGKLDEHP